MVSKRSHPPDPQPLLTNSAVERLLHWTQEAQRSLGCDNVCIHLLSADRRRLICQAISHGFRATHLAYGLDVTAAPGAFHAIRDQKTVAVDNALDDERVARVARERYGLSACLYTPLVVDGRGVGVTIFSFQQPHTWSADEQAAAKALTDECVSLLPDTSEAAWPSQASAAEPRLRTMLDAAPGLLLAVDRSLMVFDSNSTLVELADRDHQAWLFDLLQRSSRAKDLCLAMVDIFEGLRPSFAGLTELDHQFWRIDLRPIPPSDGGPVRAIAVSCGNLESSLQARQILEDVRQTEALGRISASVAHEYNNLMQILSASLESLTGDSDESTCERARAAAADALDRGSKLARQLLTFAQAQPTEPRRFDLRQRIVAWWPLLESTVGRDRPLELALEPCAPVVADPEQLRLALINLLLNARDASHPGQGIQVRLGTRRDDDHRGGGRDTVLAVRDTGVGMTGDVLHRATEPFVTTKPRGLGVGLGLAVAKSIATAAGGSLHIESAIGQGTTVELRLPATEVDVPQPRQVTEPETASKGRVLVVEDEDLTLEWLHRILQRSGFETRLAATGEEMRRLLQAEPGWPQLVVLDMILPDAEGGQLYRELQKARPGLPVVVSTGYADGREIVSIRQDGHPILTKPYSAQDLLTTISELPGLAQTRAGTGSVPSS